MIHFKDAREVLNILRDMVTYLSIQSKNDKLGEVIIGRALKVLEDNSNMESLNGDKNKNKN